MILSEAVREAVAMLDAASDDELRLAYEETDFNLRYATALRELYKLEAERRRRETKETVA